MTCQFIAFHCRIAWQIGEENVSLTKAIMRAYFKYDAVLHNSVSQALYLKVKICFKNTPIWSPQRFSGEGANIPSPEETLVAAVTPTAVWHCCTYGSLWAQDWAHSALNSSWAPVTETHLPSKEEDKWSQAGRYPLPLFFCCNELI